MQNASRIQGNQSLTPFDLALGGQAVTAAKEAADKLKADKEAAAVSAKAKKEEDAAKVTLARLEAEKKAKEEKEAADVEK